MEDEIERLKALRGTIQGAANWEQAKEAVLEWFDIALAIKRADYDAAMGFFGVDQQD